MKNRTTRIGMTALAILLAAGATVNAVPSFAGLAVVHAEEQNFPEAVFHIVSSNPFSVQAVSEA